MSLLVGEIVIFSPNDFTVRKGLIMGEVVMKFKDYDIFPTTGYSILTDDTKQIEHIPYYQVKFVVEPDISYLELLEKQGDLIEVNFPKYHKEHPKGWFVNGDGNTDLPFN